MLFSSKPTFFNENPSRLEYLKVVLGSKLREFSIKDFTLRSRDHSFTVHASDIGKERVSPHIVYGNDLPVIKNISLVGAVYRRIKGLVSPMVGLFWRDAETLRRSLEYAKATGYPLAEKLNISIVNIAYGRDFLSTDPKQIIPADLVVSSFVYNPPLMNDTDRELLEMITQINPENSSTSNHHRTPFAWHDAAVRTGSHLITAFRKPYDFEEVCAPHFVGPNIKLERRLANVPIGNQPSYVLEALTCHK